MSKQTLLRYLLFVAATQSLGCVINSDCDAICPLQIRSATSRISKTADTPVEVLFGESQRGDVALEATLVADAGTCDQNTHGPWIAATVLSASPLKARFLFTPNAVGLPAGQHTLCVKSSAAEQVIFGSTRVRVFAPPQTPSAVAEGRPESAQVLVQNVYLTAPPGPAILAAEYVPQPSANVRLSKYIITIGTPSSVIRDPAFTNNDARYYNYKSTTLAAVTSNAALFYYEPQWTLLAHSFTSGADAKSLTSDRMFPSSAKLLAGAQQSNHFVLVDDRNSSIFAADFAMPSFTPRGTCPLMSGAAITPLSVAIHSNGTATDFRVFLQGKDGDRFFARLCESRGTDTEPTLTSLDAVAQTSPASTTKVLAAFADVDGDALTDLVLLSASSPTELHWFPGLERSQNDSATAPYGSAERIALPTTILPLTNPQSLSLGALDNPGQLGIVVATPQKIVLLKLG